MGQFDREIRSFRDTLDTWLSEHRGQWVVIHQDRVLGFYGTHAEGYQAAVEQLDEEPFLLRQVVPSRNSPVPAQTSGRQRVCERHLPASKPGRSMKAGERLALHIVLGTVFLSVPAFLNGCPFIFWGDSIGYLQGQYLLHSIYTQTPAGFDCRSVFYTTAIYPLHLGHVPWAVVLVQSLAAMVALEFTTLKLFPHCAMRTRWAMLVALLALTPIGFLCDMVTPDIFTAIGLLGLCWLGPGESLLSSSQRLWVTVVTAACLCCHNSNWLLGVAFCAVFMACRRTLRVWAVLPVAAATLLQVALNTSVYQRPMLFAPHPPFLLARLTADGLVSRYFQENDRASSFALFAYRDQLPVNSNSDTFLWHKEGLAYTVYRTDPHAWQTIKDQELSLCWAVIRSYPSQEAMLGVCAWLRQMLTFDRGFLWMPADAARLLPRLEPNLDASWQATHSKLPRTLSHFDFAFFVVATAFLVGWRPHGPLRNFLLWIVVGLVLSAGINADLSGVTNRYQARVEWLIPYLAMLRWLQLRSAQPSQTSRSLAEDPLESRPGDG